MYHFTAHGRKATNGCVRKKLENRKITKESIQSFGTGKSATFPLQNFMNRSHKRSCRDTIRSKEPI